MQFNGLEQQTRKSQHNQEYRSTYCAHTKVQTFNCNSCQTKTDL